MIVWLASYPKSGNTFVRSLLCSYIFSENGNFSFELLKNIKQFPDKTLFKQIGVDINSEEEMYKNYINTQKIFNKKDTIRFLKTHSCFVNTKKFQFTDRHNTLGVIYIVRDPRNIVTSHSHHFQKTPEESLENLLSHQVLTKDHRHCTTYLGSWKYHYNSWKVFRRFNKYLLVRYEDLINDTEKTFLNILKFIAHLGRVKFTYDKQKFENSIKTTGFENMQKLEATGNFVESKKDKKTGENIKFFNMGVKNDWKKLLDDNIKEKLERELVDEMKELNYL